jgi:hypothetical protein
VVARLQNMIRAWIEGRDDLVLAPSSLEAHDKQRTATQLQASGKPAETMWGWGALKLNLRSE